MALSESLLRVLCEKLEDGLSERLGEMLCKKLCEMLDADMLQVYFRQASSRVQESYNLSQLPSPDEGPCLFYTNTAPEENGCVPNVSFFMCWWFLIPLPIK